MCNLVIYTFTFIYSQARRAFPKAKYSVVCTEFPMSLKFYFSKWKTNFPYSFSVKNTLDISLIKIKM